MQRWKSLPEQNKDRWRILGVFLLLVPFFEPGYVSICAPMARIVYNAGQVISTLVVLGLFIRLLFREKKLSIAAWALIALEGWTGIDVLIHQGVNKAAFLGIISVMVVCMLIEVTARRNMGVLLNVFLLLYEVLIGLNFLSMLIWPNGLYYTPSEEWDNWLLGYRNMFLFYFAPALALELLNMHRTGKRTRLHVMLLICVASMLLGKTKTGQIGVVVFAALYITGLYRWKGCNILTVSLAAIAAHVSIVGFNLQRLFASVFDLLGRQTTFTGRTGIWARTIELIRECPLVGYGLQPDDVRGQVTGLWNGVKAHNLFLEQQYCLGAIGTILLIAFLAISAYGLYKEKRHPYAAALCMGMICIHLLMLMESHINNIPMYSFLFLICFAEQFIAQLPLQKA